MDYTEFDPSTLNQFKQLYSMGKTNGGNLVFRNFETHLEFKDENRGV